MSGVYSTPPRYLGWLAAGEFFEILTLKIEFSGYFPVIFSMFHCAAHAAHNVHAHQYWSLYMHVQATHFPPRQ